MADFLADIVEHVRAVVEQRQKQTPLASLHDRPLYHQPTRGFARGLIGETRRIIGEVKRSSPSKGLIRADFSPVVIARDYTDHGASAISVLTEERFFQGSLTYLEEIKAAVPVPLLRKDFIIDRYQVTEARRYGADAILLIAALLDPALLRELHEAAAALSLDTLVEVHNEEELGCALEAGAEIIGINNRDLKTFQVSLATTEKLAPRVPAGTLTICESGIDGAEQIRQVERWGIHTFLIGESLMRAPSPGEKLQELLRS
ncbi:MAG TPA: indole-3-glycerol phosphate synthase TrpC [Candidatus Binatia bacterium]